MQSIVNRLSCSLRTALNTFSLPFRPFLDPQFALPESALSNRSALAGTSVNFREILTGIWLMGVPKSKVSPSRKRMKHIKYFPDKVGWYTCEKCGEPKRPHRICSDHIEVCAMKPEQWSEVKAKKIASSTEIEA